MKIASVTNTPPLPHLGSGKTVIEWTSGFRRLGHQVDVYAPQDFYAPLPAGRGRRIKMRFDTVKLESRLRSGVYDLIEFYGGEFGWLIAKLASRAFRPLLVAHTNGLELLAYENERISTSLDLKRFLRSPLEKLIQKCDYSAFAKADRFAAICALDAEYVVSHGIQPFDRTAVVEPGVDEEFLSAAWNQPKVHRVICLGSWTARKDPETMVAVLSRLLTEDPLLKCDFVGAGDQEYEIKSGFLSTLHGRIRVHPRLEKSAIVDLLARAKVFFFPSLYEGFGMATAEAMACGCAPVVTPTGFGGSLEDGREALVRPFRDVETLCEAVSLLLNNAELRDCIARAGRSRVEGMTWERQVVRLEAVYRRWCDEFASAQMQKKERRAGM